MKPNYVHDDKREIDQLKAELRQLRIAFCTAVAWIAESAGSPLSTDNAEELIRLAERRPGTGPA